MNTDIKQAVEKEYRKAENYYASELQQDEERSEQYYFKKQPQEIDPDISEFFKGIVTSDFADAVEHTLADIMPAFSTEPPVKFLAQGPEDEKQAYVETEVVNDIFMEQNDGYTVALAACKDALMYRRGYIHVNVEKKAIVEYMTLENVSIESVNMLKFQAEQQGQQLDIIDIDGELTETENGQVIDSNLTVQLRRTTQKNVLDVSSVRVDELLVNPEHEEVSLDNARFVSRERKLTEGELIQLGYSEAVVKNIPTYSRVHRKARHTDAYLQDSEHSHKSTRPILVAYIYIRVDDDGDGIPELRYVFAAGNFPSEFTILENKPIARQPFAMGVPFLYAHKFYGISLYDKLKEVQIIKTKVLRQLLTAGERAVRGRLGVVGDQANKLDVAETTFGGIVRLTTPNGVVPIPADRFPVEVMQLIEYSNRWRSEAGGSAIDKAHEEIQVGGETAHGLERLMSAMEQLNSLIAKLLAETLIKQTYTKIHQLYKEHFPEQINQKIQNEWIVTTPQEWPAERKTATAIGLTMGDRLRLAAAYDRMIMSHQEMAKLGSIIVSEDNLYRLNVNRAQAMGVPNPYSYFLDPSSPEGMQAQQQKQQMMAQQQQQQQQMQQQQMEMQAKMLMEVEQIRAMSKVQVQELQNQVTALQAQLTDEQKRDDLTLKYDELAVKLAELNAKYDQEEIPDAPAISVAS